MGFGLPDLVSGPKRASRTLPNARWRWSLTRPPRDLAWSAARAMQASTRGFVVGGRLGVDEALGEVEQGWLLAAGSGQQGAHGNRRRDRTDIQRPFRVFPGA